MLPNSCPLLIVPTMGKGPGAMGEGGLVWRVIFSDASCPPREKKWHQDALWGKGKLAVAMWFSEHSCGCYFVKYHLSKHCHRPSVMTQSRTGLQQNRIKWCGENNRQQIVVMKLCCYWYAMIKTTKGLIAGTPVIALGRDPGQNNHNPTNLPHETERESD